jgi:SAM-dependent methyltransferase
MVQADSDARRAAPERTIRDFGEQWSHYAENEGFYGSLDLLQDVFGPLLQISDLRGLRAADVGSGTGRIARMLLEGGAEHVIALEPSSAIEILRRNLRSYGGRVEAMQATGDRLPAGLGLDLVISYGVIQFIPDPGPTLRAAREALRPGGRLVIWVYGREGLGPYLLAVRALRGVTTRLPHSLLSALCSALNLGLDAYIPLCRILPLPLRSYALGTLARLERSQRKLVIYDQLNPSYVRFYTGDEIRAAVAAAGFSDVRLHHRRGYSWTVLAHRPD